MNLKNKDIILEDKVFLLGAIATLLILSIPLIAMQYTNEVNWELGDFVAAGILLFGMGSIFVFSARKFRQTSQRIVIGILVLLVFLYLWAELAVGIFTNLGS